MGRFKYVGEVEAIHGQYFEIPDEIQAPQARRYIEQLHEEEIAAAALEQQQRADAERQDAIRNQASDPGELAELREELEGLHQRLDAPDGAKYIDAIDKNAAAMQSAWSISQNLRVLEEQARAATEQHQYTLDSAETFYREANQERDRTLAVIRANQKIVNGSISSTSKEIANLRQQLADAKTEIGELKASASANRQLINRASQLVKAWESRETGE